MQRACIQWGGAAATVALGAAAWRTGQGRRQYGHEARGRRARSSAPSRPQRLDGEQKGELSDSAVRVLMTYALSIIPDTYPGPDGKPVKVDKIDPNKFVIPVDDARRIVRVATRSAYAEVCKLEDLERANYPDADEGRGGEEGLEPGPDRF